MQPLFTYNVIPKLSEELEPLRELGFNLWWTWEPEARKLFRHLDVELWERTNHNPLRMLQLSRQGRLEQLSRDEEFLEALEKVYAKFKDYMSNEDTYAGKRDTNRPSVAYFSAEFGFHESLSNYSGGLGILAGDHCKSASDLGLDLCGVSLLYRHGYFRQQINREGWQESVQLNQNFHQLPIREVRRRDKSLQVSVDLPGRKVFAKVWRLSIGRVELYLLDTDIPENSADDRLITSQLYGGDIEMRIRQGILLGIGGVRALHEMEIRPDVYHMNEGHAAFLSLERIRRRVETDGLDFYSALQATAASSVFTTHSPVAAGNDAFSRSLMNRYFGDYPASVGLTFDEFFRFGQYSVNPLDTFSMTILALRTCRHSNGVAERHGRTSRGLWKDVWAGVPREEVPIDSITNGIHTKTWMAPEFSRLFTKHLGDWEPHLTEPDFWRRVIDIPDDELWETHQYLKGRLIDFVRRRVRARRERIGESPEKIREANQLLDPEILTIGFARRFATYKRASLLLTQPDRLRKIVSDVEYPVQFIFAGKAHPADEGGKRLIQEVDRFSRESGLEKRFVFIEDYDTYVARRLTQGVDLWLNNPLRPLEASGTSGMKLPPNGGLNLSVLDGWWCEGYNGKNGWAIATEISEAPSDVQNEVDAASLFHLLENQIIPLYYAKPDGRLPIAWLQLMRESIRSVTPVFNTHRMVKEYNERIYEMASESRRKLTANGFENAKAVAAWKAQIRKKWPQIRVVGVRVGSNEGSSINVGESLKIEARVYLGEVPPESVRVQIYYGESDDVEITDPVTIDLSNGGTSEMPGEYCYKGSIPAEESGTYGFNVRVIPYNANLTQAHELRLITWAK
jgi:starch phosphorylase